MKQTAVDYLAEKYYHITWLRNRDEISAGRADELRADAYEQAKEIEKQQIMDAYWDGGQDIPTSYKTCKWYYNETFDSNK